LIGAEVVFIKVSLTFPVPAAAAFVIPITAALVQVNAAPGVALVAVYVNGMLHPIVGVRLLDNMATGFTTTTTA
jgi:hypothetical protein